MDRALIYKSQSEGFTLMELVLYMSLCTVLMSGVLYSSFYLQSVMQYNSVEYKAQENTYRQLELLQQYLLRATKVEISASAIRIYNPKGYVSQELHDGVMHMIYHYNNTNEKNIIVYPFIRFTEFSFDVEELQDTLLTKSLLHVHTERVDSRGKIRTFQEYLIVPYFTTLVL